jgi:hypothetical protein
MSVPENYHAKLFGSASNRAPVFQTDNLFTRKLFPSVHPQPSFACPAILHMFAGAVVPSKANEKVLPNIERPNLNHSYIYRQLELG